MFKTFQTLVFALVAIFIIIPTNTFAAFEDEFEYGETKAWGGSGDDISTSVIAADGSLYVYGTFENTVNFDTTGGTDERTSAGSLDAYLTKYNTDGTYAWTRTWGGVGTEYSSNITVIHDTLYITGRFQNVVDFDTTGGTDEHTSIGSYDSFITKYNTDGSYAWTRTWGGVGSDGASSVTVTEDALYVTGRFQNVVDFDPTGGIDGRTSLGSIDAFLTKYNTDGSYSWTRTWGSTGADYTLGVTVVDEMLYVIGYFSNTVDFDITGSVDERTSSGGNDAFLTSYNTDGTYAWTRTWGGTGNEYPSSIIVIDNLLYVTGSFNNTVNFDSTGGTDEHISSGVGDAFLTKYNTDGSYVWTRTWGGTGSELGWSITAANSTLYVSGNFENTVNFDSTDGIDARTSVGSYDVFLTKYNTDGSYAWTRTWGGTGTDIGYGVTASDNYLYVTGSFNTTVNFNIASSTDERTSAGSTDAFLTKYHLLTYGCTDEVALNYNSDADRDDGSCRFRSSSGSSGTNVKKRVANLIEEGESEAAEAIMERNEKIFSTTTESNNPTLTILETLQTQLIELLKQFKDLTGQEFSLTTPVTIPLRDLDLDMEGSDVTALQTLLINNSYEIVAGPTGYFGTQTQTALANYQKDHNITPATGYFGPITQKYLKQANTQGLWW